ncbi:MAG: hypothetical protein ABI665_19700 [Vicinamibacterales bacterium]
MKKTQAKPSRRVTAEPMPEMDFSKGVRGKYYERYWESVRAGTIKDPRVPPAVKPRTASSK